MQNNNDVRIAGVRNIDFRLRRHQRYDELGGRRGGFRAVHECCEIATQPEALQTGNTACRLNPTGCGGVWKQIAAELRDLSALDDGLGGSSKSRSIASIQSEGCRRVEGARVNDGKSGSFEIARGHCPRKIECGLPLGYERQAKQEKQTTEAQSAQRFCVLCVSVV